MNGFSINLGKAKKPARRENVLGGDREREKEEERRVVAIDSFGHEAEKTKEKQPLVIPRLANAPIRSEEDEAIDALLHGDRPSLQSIAVPEQVVRTDVAHRPEMASLQAYAAVPIEEFGWAALRGMGWQEGQSIGRRRGDGAAGRKGVRKERERRPPFLGLGARLAMDEEGRALEGPRKQYQPLKRVHK